MGGIISSPDRDVKKGWLGCFPGMVLEFKPAVIHSELDSSGNAIEKVFFVFPWLGCRIRPHELVFTANQAR